MPETGESSADQQQTEAREDPFSLWASNQTREVAPDSELVQQLSGGQSAEQDLQKGDVAFYYDEWDRELGDYRSRYYPRSLQTDDGTIYVFGHNGADNRYGEFDQSVDMDTFRLRSGD